MVSSDKTVEVELHWGEKLKVLSFIRDLDPFMMDDYKKGEGKVPSPVEMFLSAVGSCLIMAFIYCLHLSRVVLNPDDFQVKVSGKLGRIAERLRVISVEAEFILRNVKKDSQKIQKCFQKFQPFCILSESVAAGISFACNLKIEE